MSEHSPTSTVETYGAATIATLRAGGKIAVRSTGFIPGVLQAEAYASVAVGQGLRAYSAAAARELAAARLNRNSEINQALEAGRGTMSFAFSEAALLQLSGLPSHVATKQIEHLRRENSDPKKRIGVVALAGGLTVGGTSDFSVMQSPNLPPTAWVKLGDEPVPHGDAKLAVDLLGRFDQLMAGETVIKGPDLSAYLDNLQQKIGA